jgi:hypothetical protein
VRFPRRFNDYLPRKRTAALAHIPSKENRNPPQAIVDPDSQGVLNPAPGVDGNSGSDAARDETRHDDAEAVTTDADSFGVYCIYAQKPFYGPLQCRSHDARPLAPGDSSSDCRLGSAPNQGPFHPDMQNAPYYHPFSTPSAAAMMIAHHSGTPLQSEQKTTQIAHILGSLGPDLNPLDLCNFDAALENKKLDAYLASAPESRSPPSIVRPADDNDEAWESYYVNLQVVISFSVIHCTH